MAVKMTPFKNTIKLTRFRKSQNVKIRNNDVEEVHEKIVSTIKTYRYAPCWGNEVIIIIGCLRRDVFKNLSVYTRHITHEMCIRDSTNIVDKVMHTHN